MKRPLLILSLSVLALPFSAKNSHAQDPYWDAAYGSDFADAGSTSGSGGGLFGASEFSYGYLDAGYFFHDFQRDNMDNVGGFGGSLSIPLADSLYLKGGLDFATPTDTEGRDLDYFAWKFGAGFGIPLGGIFDLVLEAGLGHQKLDGDSLVDGIDGYSFYVTPWLRTSIGDLIELNAGVTFANVDSDSNVGVDLRALLHLTPNVSLFGEAVLAEELNRYGAGLRINF